MRTKRITALLLAVLFCLSAGCGGGSKYADNVLVSGIIDRVDQAIGKDDGSMIAVDELYINNTMKIDATEIPEFVVKINAYGANVDEYGIFKANDADHAKQIADQVEAYLKMRNDTWMTEYMPEERPKMQAASFVTYGNYVMYAVLDDDLKQTAFSTLESCLKEG